MPSIIEQVSEAEKRAAAIRHDAAVKAREAVEAAEGEVQKRAKQRRLELRDMQFKAEEEATRESEEKSSELFAANAKRSDEIVLNASKKLDKATEYILKGVK